MAATIHPPANVLIVEDDRSTRKALAKLLSVTGFNVTTARSLADARAKLADHRIVLLDLGLPDGDGEQLVGWMREKSHPATIAVISAQIDPRAGGRFQWIYPPDVAFPKPLDVERFLDWLQSHGKPLPGVNLA